MGNLRIEQAANLMLQELKQEIEKGVSQEIKYSRIHELLAVVYEPVRFLASRETNIRFKS